MQAVQSRGRDIPVVTRRRAFNPRAAAEALFAKGDNPRSETKREPRILDDITRTPLPINAGAIDAETEHQKTFRLAKEGKFEDAARTAARLVNGGDVSGFFVFGGNAAYRKCEDAFNRAVLDAQSDPASGVFDLSPNLAQIMLSRNDGNRRVKAGNLNRLMRDISAGRFVLNGETIIVSANGEVNDGQHRCLAVLLTGRTVKTVMTFGVSRESMRTVDIGEKRQAKDRLGIAGISDYVRLSAIASLAFSVYNGRAATPPEADDYFRANREIIERGASATTTNMKGVGPAAAGVAAMHLLRMGFAEADIRDFFAKVRSGEMLSKNDPRMTLHRAIFVDKYKQKLHREDWLRAFVHHFIALKGGRKPTELQYTKPLPEVR